MTWLLGPDATGRADDGLEPGTAYAYTLTASDGRGPSAPSSAGATTFAGPATVEGRYVFYNNSFFDGRDGGAGPADDAAVATDKSALFGGAAPAFQNVTSYARGINGVMLDLRGAWGTVGAGDFRFGLSSVDGESTAPAPSSVTVRRGAGAGGSDRVTLVWPDGAIRNAWLRVTVLSNGNTGLSQPHTFSFGNLVGESTGATGGVLMTVNWADLLPVRRHRSPRRVVDITSPYDHNRDGRINALDVAAVKGATGGTLALRAPAAEAPPAAAAATALVREDRPARPQ